MDPATQAHLSAMRMEHQGAPNTALGSNAAMLSASLRRKGDYHKRADGKQAVVRLSPALFALIEGLKECMSLASGGITVTKMDVVSFFLEAAYSEIDRLFTPRRAMPGWMDRESALRGAWEAELETRRKAGVVGPLHPPARPLRFAPASVSPSVVRDGVAEHESLPIAYATVFSAQHAGIPPPAHGGEAQPVGPTSGLGSRGRHKWGRKTWFAGMPGRGGGGGVHPAMGEYDQGGAAGGMGHMTAVGSEMMVHQGMPVDPTANYGVAAAAAGGHPAQMGIVSMAPGMGALDARTDVVGYAAPNATASGRQGRRQLAWTQPNAARNRHAWLREAMRSAEVAAAQEQPMVWSGVSEVSGASGAGGAEGAGEGGESAAVAHDGLEGRSVGEEAAEQGMHEAGHGGAGANGQGEVEGTVGEGAEGVDAGEAMGGMKRKVEEMELREEEEARKRQALEQLQAQEQEQLLQQQVQQQQQEQQQLQQEQQQLQQEQLEQHHEGHVEAEGGMGGMVVEGGGEVMGGSEGDNNGGGNGEAGAEAEHEAGDAVIGGEEQQTENEASASAEAEAAAAAAAAAEHDFGAADADTSAVDADADAAAAASAEAAAANPAPEELAEGAAGAEAPEEAAADDDAAAAAAATGVVVAEGEDAVAAE